METETENFEEITVAVTQKHWETAEFTDGPSDRCPVALALLDAEFDDVKVGSQHVEVERGGRFFKAYLGVEAIHLVCLFDAGEDEASGKFTRPPFPGETTVRLELEPVCSDHLELL